MLAASSAARYVTESGDGRLEILILSCSSPPVEHLWRRFTPTLSRVQGRFPGTPIAPPPSTFSSRGCYGGMNPPSSPSHRCPVHLQWRDTVGVRGKLALGARGTTMDGGRGWFSLSASRWVSSKKRWSSCWWHVAGLSRTRSAFGADTRWTPDETDNRRVPRTNAPCLYPECGLSRWHPDVIISETIREDHRVTFAHGGLDSSLQDSDSDRLEELMRDKLWSR